jgi:hypothetical protein
MLGERTMAIETYEFELNANTLVEGQKWIEFFFDIRMQPRFSEFVGGEYCIYRFPLSDEESVEIRVYVNGMYCGQRISGAFPPDSVILEITGTARAAQLVQRIEESEGILRDVPKRLKDNDTP